MSRLAEYPQYEIYPDGRIFSYKTNKFLKKTFTNGYEFVELFNESGSKRMSVHRLVAEAFIPNPDNLPCVNHKDETRTNNNVENLEWCTYKYNTNYGTCIARRTMHTDYSSDIYKKLAINANRKMWKQVLQFDKDGNFICSFENIKKASVATGARQGRISACCKGKAKTAGGFIWKYGKEEKQSCQYFV